MKKKEEDSSKLKVIVINRPTPDQAKKRIEEISEKINRIFSVKLKESCYE